MVRNLRLSALKFAAGSAPTSPPLEVACPNVVILIGPNNAGKSQALRDIESAVSGSRPAPSGTVVSEVEIDFPDDGETIQEMMKDFEGKSTLPGYATYRRPVMAGQSDVAVEIKQSWFSDWTNGEQNHLRSTGFLRFFTHRLDGASRFNLVSDQPSGDLGARAANHLWSLFQNEPARKKISEFTQGAFRRFFVVDPTGMTSFKMRLSERAPVDIQEEQGLDPRAQAFHANATLISSFGDGVKASVGLVAAVHSLPDRILLVDEPEAFLHPTLARRIGSALTETARARDASLVVATHSAEFLVGCIQSTSQLRLVRLTFDSGRSTARTLEPVEISSLMNDPLLRSANALRALFHRAVIVCEADSDRAFYEEINARLSVIGRGIDDALFMNGQNWQTIPRLVQPLRRLGVPAAAVMDLDVIMDKDFGKHVWPLLDADPTELSRLKMARAKAKRYMEGVSKSAIKTSGLNALGHADRTAVEELITDFASYGVFFVPGGELESWLTASNASRTNKAKWVLEVFRYLGSDPADTGYVNPAEGDVWKFLNSMKGWTDDPERKGIPT